MTNSVFLTNKNARSCQLYYTKMQHFMLIVRLQRIYALVRQFQPRPAPTPPATTGHLPALPVPEVGRLQILRCQGAGHLPTPGPTPNFWHARGFLSEYNYTAGLGQLELTDPLLDDKKVKWAIHWVFKREYIPDRNQIFSETFDMVMLCSFDIRENQA